MSINNRTKLRSYVLRVLKFGENYSHIKKKGINFEGLYLF